ncbi:transcriptional regulator, LacI family [Kushneria avicenniae]|uniref:Transcriptional regulator, LacI family n=1 Tax=Kushneria avicenniae TaxID=402385 RepID=A0A1I1J5M7_9GAMM|nr:LacI family DNA-binding transcriptional regulator [Kushneria avicenniae]SFC43919.1 transcriptional regulator, LacI family [Kushneria avicenniae]
MSINKVAREAGVSIATVSRVINNTGAVRPSTRERVEAAIATLGYSANRLARNLRTAESRLILVLVPDYSNPFYAGIVRGIDAEAGRRGYHMLLCDTGADPDAQRTYLELLTNRMADGAICLDPDSIQALTGEQTRHLPWVACCEFDAASGVPWVGIDNARAATDAVRFLIERGRRHIAMIGGDERFMYARERRRGYLTALEEAGLTPPPGSPLDTFEPDFDDGYRLTTRLLSASPRCDALFAASDPLAVGAMQAVHDAGLKVPDDIAIIGFDNIPLAAMVRPRLTTVAQPMQRLGENAARLLLEQLNDPELPPAGTLLEHELIVRESA